MLNLLTSINSSDSSVCRLQKSISATFEKSEDKTVAIRCAFLRVSNGLPVAERIPYPKGISDFIFIY